MIDVFDTPNDTANSNASAETHSEPKPHHIINFSPDSPTPAEAPHKPAIDFGPVEDKTHGLIKVVGVGGGGCNAVRNMFNEGIVDVNFAVCNTDSKSLSTSPVPVKLPIGNLGAGGNPEEGRKAAQSHLEEIKRLFSDGTKMVFVTAGMGGGTGTGAAPVIAGVAKSMGLLTIGIVTIPFFFEKKRKIIKALKGVEEMRKNVDALLIVNNERLCDVYADSEITVKDAFKLADKVLSDATKSISELITVEGTINLDFRDIETTIKSGGAIMAMGRASGEGRVQNAILNALDSPLLYGSDISNAQRILFNIYTSSKHPIFVREMREIDAFFDELNPDIKVIWGLSDDDSLDEDAKVTILATGLNNELADEIQDNPVTTTKDEDDYQRIIDKLYHPIRDNFQFQKKKDSPKEEIPTNPSTNESTNIPDEPAPLIPEAPIEESPVIEEEPIEPVVQQEPPTLAKRIRDRLKKIAEDLDIITEDE